MDGMTADYFVDREFQVSYTYDSLVRDCGRRQIPGPYHWLLQTYGGQWYAMATHTLSGSHYWRGPAFDDPIAAYVHAEVQCWSKED